MRKYIALVTFLLLGTVPRSLAADGGTLQMKPGQATIRGLEQIPRYEDRTDQATLDLGGPEPEDVTVFKIDESFRPMVTGKEPFRLYLDSNGDGEPQPGEIHEATRTPDTRTISFNDVPFSMNIPGGRIPTDISVFVHEGGGELRYLQLGLPQLHFEGTITLNGQEYGAVIFFRSVTDTSARNGKVVLDTNGDGSFDWLTDSWFPANGGFCFDGSLLVSRTTFDDRTAEIAITPYTGPTGRIEIRGTGFYRTRISALFDPDSGFNSDILDNEICLASNENQAWELPVGNYSAQEVWLRSSSDPDLFWKNKWSHGLQDCSVRIEEGETGTLDLGGPLTQKISISTFLPSLMGKVFVDYATCKNPEGIEFEPIHRTPSGVKDLSWKPSFEILDEKGQVIASADFEHG